MIISRPFDLKQIETQVHEQTRNLTGQIESTKQVVENLIADETNLQSKIEKKKLELDRAEKRLKSLQAVRYISLGLWDLL